MIESFKNRFSIMISDGVEYSTSEYEYRKKLRVQVLMWKNVLEYENRKKVRVRVAHFYKFSKRTIFKL